MYVLGPVVALLPTYNPALRLFRPQPSVSAGRGLQTKPRRAVLAVPQQVCEEGYHVDEAGGCGGCFPSHATVSVRGRGTLRMEQLRYGDEVRTTGYP